MAFLLTLAFVGARFIEPAFTSLSPFGFDKSNPYKSEHFRRERDDLHEAFAAQLARDRPEDARADRLELVVQQHGSVAVEADQRTIGATHALARTHDDRIVDLTLLDLAARDRITDRHLDDVADAGVATLGTAEH